MQARGVHQRGERREIAGARVQAQEVETDALERGDALGEVRRRRFAPRSQDLGVGRPGRRRARRPRRSPRAPRPPAPRAPRRSPAARRAAPGIRFGSAAKSSDAATPSAASVARNADAPASARALRRAEPAREPLPSAAVPEAIADPRLPPLADPVGNELHVERVAHRAEQHRAEHGREDEHDADLGSRGSLPGASSPKVTASQVAEATVASRSTRWACGSRFVASERLGLGPLAPRDLERRAQVGERVSRPELPARLVEVEPDDRQERQRGDRGRGARCLPVHPAGCRPARRRG